MNNQDLLRIAIDAAIEAGKSIMHIYAQEFEVAFKQDESPLTLADQASNQIILERLATTEIPIISEETKEQPYSIRKNWDICWLVDPLDGTKEFVKRNGDFTVNIALIKNGMPVLGVIFVPCLNLLYYADKDLGKAAKLKTDIDLRIPEDLFHTSVLIKPSAKRKDLIRVVGSRSHMNEETAEYMRNLLKFYEQTDIVSRGSSLKFCIVAEGEADIYPRFGPTMEWDTAAGQAICEAVGLKVTACDSLSPLAYNKRNLLNPNFIVE